MLLIGTCIGLVGFLLTSILYSVEVTWKVTGAIGAISWILAAILSGALVSGDRVRSNYYSEDKEDSIKRERILDILFIFGLPNIVLSIILFLVVK